MTADRLNTPAKITFDSSDLLYVVDFNNNRVQKFILGNNTGITVAGMSGSAGNTAHHLQYPVDVAIDSNGNIYVVDTNNQRVQLWNVSATNGTTVVGNGKSKE